MKNIHYMTALSLVVSVMLSPMATAEPYSWQLSLLFQPTEKQIEREQKGRVMIFHGLKDTMVQKVMDQQFDRIDSMMFTGTIVTDVSGHAVRDPESGDLVVEDDC